MNQATSTFCMTCWGCSRMLYRSSCNEEDYERQMQELMAAGWQRRTFGPGADPWFCSNECAQNSSNARRAAHWWAEKKAKDETAKLIPQVIAGGCLLVGLIAFIVSVVR